MKQIFLLPVTLSILSIYVNAQNSSPYWSLSGNSRVTDSSKFGTTNRSNLRFYTNNKQRMIINADSGFVGIGVRYPEAHVHINNAAGTDPLRVEVNGSAKLLVHKAGGVAIGGDATPPPNGLYVSGDVEIGTKTPGAKLEVTNIPVYTTRPVYAIRGNSEGPGGSVGVYGTSNYNGVVGYSSDSSYNGAGVVGKCEGCISGVLGSSLNYGIRGFGSIGAAGYSISHIGVLGQSDSGIGVYGTSNENIGGNFSSIDNYGIVAATTNAAYAGVFYGSIYSGPMFETSDKNLKTNINAFGDAMSIINKLKPQNYEFKKDAKYASLNLPKGSHYGLLAQDLEEVLPNLVSEAPHELKTMKRINIVKPDLLNSKPTGVIPKEKEIKETINIKAVNYTELIPILVKGMQELSKENADLKNQIDDLKLLISGKDNNSTTASNQGYIKQNAPNPSNNNTIISYYTPDNTRNAQILISDMKGSVLKAYNISKGAGQVNIRSGEFSTGTYNYTLYIDNNKIDTKKMIIIK